MDDYQDIMTRKLGLTKYNKKLIGELLKNMVSDKVDYTNFFRSLSNIKADPAIPEDQLLIPLKDVLLDIGMERREAWTNWIKSYIQEVCDNEFPYSNNTTPPPQSQGSAIIILTVYVWSIYAHFSPILYNFPK